MSLSTCPSFRLSYIDFPPNCSSNDDVLCSPQFEKFYSLMGRANEWLRDHSGLKVVTCETIKVKVHSSGKVVTSRSCYFKYDQTKKRFRNVFVKALRLWVTPKKDGERLTQQIGYVNVLPWRNNVQTSSSPPPSSSSSSSLPSYDSISETIVRFNDYLKVHPIPGEVLNIETDELKFHDWGFGGNDADECCWVESALLSITQLNFVRVYFQLGPPSLETIGCVDFIPSKRDTKFNALVFEDFRSVVSLATSWVRQQQRSEPNMRVTNMQTIEYKFKNPSLDNHHHHHQFTDDDLKKSSSVEIDCQQSCFSHSNKHCIRSFRYLRLYFTRQIHSPSAFSMSSAAGGGVTFTFDYVTFEPRLLSYGGIFGVPLFETLVQTMRRAMIWMDQLSEDVDILAAETIPVRLVPRSETSSKKKKKKTKHKKREEEIQDSAADSSTTDDDDDDDETDEKWLKNAMESDDGSGVKWIFGDRKNEFCLFLLRFYFNSNLTNKKQRAEQKPTIHGNSEVETPLSSVHARPIYLAPRTSYECVVI